MSRRKLALGLTLMLGLTAVSTGPRAQTSDSDVPPAGCAYCYNDAYEQAHTVSYTRQFWFSGMVISCTGFNSCHYYVSQPGSCAEYHWACSTGGGDAMARTIGRALARNDAATVRTLFARYPRRVKLENDHLHIAVLNCDGRVHRRIAVPQRMAVSLGPQTSTI